MDLSLGFVPVTKEWPGKVPHIETTHDCVTRTSSVIGVVDSTPKYRAQPRDWVGERMDTLEPVEKLETLGAKEGHVLSVLLSLCHQGVTVKAKGSKDDGRQLTPGFYKTLIF